MDRIQAMQLFVEVADRGSLTAAADALDISRAMASRYLEALERWLGVRLMHRTTRRVSLTDAGSEAIERCRQVLELTRDVQTIAGARRAEPSGTLRVTTSASFAQAHLSAAVAAFLDLHPRLRVELLALDRAVNLVEERIDLAVRITDRLDPSLLARRIGPCRSVICAAPSYLAGHSAPMTIETLAHHRCAIHEHMRAGFRLRRDGRSIMAPVNAVLTSNDTEVIRQAALAGAGVTVLPTYLVSDDLAGGRLRRVLVEYEPEPLSIYAVYLSRQYQPRPLRLLLDFLVARFTGESPRWDRTAQIKDSSPSTPARRGRRSTAKKRVAR